MTIAAIRSALPSIVETFEDIARQTGGDPAFIRDKVGVHRRHLLGPDESGVSLSAQACRRLFDEADLDPATVDLLIFVTQNPDRRLPQNSAGLAAALGLRPGVAAFDIALGCSGYVYGLAVAEAMLGAMGGRSALLVTCDPYSRIMSRSDLATNAVFGDAATATWLRGDDGGIATIGRFDFGTDGAGGEALRIDAGGATRPLVALHQHDVVVGGIDDHRLRMDGRAVFNFVVGQIPASMTRCLALNGLSAEDVDAYALHQGSAYMLAQLARQAGIAPDRMLMNIDRYANTVSSTVPLLLEDYVAGGTAAGTTVMMSGFGVGLSWATGILRFAPRIARA